MVSATPIPEWLIELFSPSLTVPIEKSSGTRKIGETTNTMRAVIVHVKIYILTSLAVSSGILEFL